MMSKRDLRNFADSQNMNQQLKSKVTRVQTGKMTRI